jgi:hypothetical protein
MLNSIGLRDFRHRTGEPRTAMTATGYGAWKSVGYTPTMMLAIIIKATNAAKAMTGQYLRI